MPNGPAFHALGVNHQTAPVSLRERLATAEWRLPGHIVADVAVEPGEGPAFTIEILTVED